MMKKRILNKLFIRLSKIIGYEVIDQNNFVSPTLNKELNEDLSLINQKSNPKDKSQEIIKYMYYYVIW